MFLGQLEPRTARTTAEVVKFALWPIAIMTVLHRVLVKAVNGARTDDFTPVYKAALAFLNRQPVYTANFNWVDPHYLYPPSGTLLMAPIAVIDPERSRWLFILGNAVAVIVAGYLLLKMFGLALDSVAAPILLFGMFASETVTNTLVFTNINGLVLLGEIAFLQLLLRRRDAWAGAAIGLTFAVKPILAPLLLLPLVTKQWRVFVTALGVPLVLTAVAWPLAVDPMEFVHHTLPYLMESRDYFNSAIVGNGAYYGLPTWLTLGLRAVFAVVVLVSLWLLYRYYREDRLFFVTTASGVLLTASFLLGSLGQMYYSMMLLPLLMSVVLRNSVMRNWPAWLAVYGFMTFDSWLSSRFPATGRAAEYMKSTLGWSLLLLVICGVLVARYVTAKREGRLADGIDPIFDDPEPEKVPVAST
ncbi:glycosyltransferase family 87 protein [Rhodococcus sp. NPDC003318]|uniref:glycosyltransferase family 87 protein n=1 Tax=Rhodococcus sp. NPDC003318 TaxID=3364503 RepID=UPI0036C1063E